MTREEKYLKVIKDEAYKKAKYSEIRRVATEAYENGSIDKRVYDALLNYKINEY